MSSHCSSPTSEFHIPTLFLVRPQGLLFTPAAEAWGGPSPYREGRSFAFSISLETPDSNQLFLRWRVCFYLLGCPMPPTLPPTSARSPTMTIVNMEILPLPWKFRWNTTPGKSVAFLPLCCVHCYFRIINKIVAISALVHQFFCAHCVIVDIISLLILQSSQSGWEWNKTQGQKWNCKVPMKCLSLAICWVELARMWCFLWLVLFTASNIHG